MSRFDTCLAFILRPDIEGGFVDDPADRGGATNQGITQATLDKYLETRELPSHSVRDLKPLEVSAIYHTSYWAPIHADDLPPPLDMIVFDAAVQHSPQRAVRWLQELVGAVADGIAGDHTLYAVKGHVLAHGATDLVNAYMDRRAQFYATLIARDPSQRRFKNGWANRMTALQDAMAKGIV